MAHKNVSFPTIDSQLVATLLITALLLTETDPLLQGLYKELWLLRQTTFWSEEAGTKRRFDPGDRIGPHWTSKILQSLSEHVT